MNTEPSKNLNTYSTAALAYLGDCVLEICVREYLVMSGLSSSARLKSSFVDKSSSTVTEKIFAIAFKDSRLG